MRQSPPTAPCAESDRPQTLGRLRRGERAAVAALDETGLATGLPEGELERRLLEMGFCEGAVVEVLHEGFPGHDPIAVRVGQTTIALRRAEAQAVLVQQTGSDGRHAG